MRKFFKSLYNPRHLDIAFGLIAVAAVTLILLSGGEFIPAIPPSDAGWLKGLALIGAALITTLIATKTTDLDQTFADDFMYQTMAKSALVTVAATILFVAGWQLIMLSGLDWISADQLIAVILLIWATAYLVTRWKGTRA